jgi:site-specific DNA-methyltransferase (adenine-specific)
MTEKPRFALRGRNPDELNCFANPSKDEVFTPPQFANLMLDTLADACAKSNHGARIWANNRVKSVWQHVTFEPNLCC